MTDLLGVKYFTSLFIRTSEARDGDFTLEALILCDGEADIHAPLARGLGLVGEVVDAVDLHHRRDVLPCGNGVEAVVARLHLGDRALDLPRRRHKHFGRRCVGLFRRGQLKLDDRLFLAEGEDADAGSEVAVDRLDAELVLSVSQREPLLSGQLDRFLLSQRRLIAADLHIVHELGDDHVVALDVAHGVVLREAPVLQTEGLVLPGDRRRGVRALEGDTAVGRAALAVRDGDLEGVDRIEAQRVELFRGDRHGQLLALGRVVDRADRLVVELLHDGQCVAVRVVDGVGVGEAEVLIPEVAVAAGNGRGGVGAGERPRPGRCAALPIADDDLDSVLAEAQGIDIDGDGVYQISRRGKRLRRLPIERLRRRQDVAGVGVIDRVGDREIAVLISEISVTVRDQRVSVQDFKDGAETEARVGVRSSVVVPDAGRIVPANRTERRIRGIRLLTPSIDTRPIPEGVMRAAKVGRVEVAVEVGGHRSREARDDLLAGDESVPLVIGGRAARVCVGGIAVVAATRQGAELVLCAVNGDLLAEDPARAVQVVPCDVDEDDTVTDEQRLVAVLDLHPLELLRVVRGRVAEAVV